MDAGHSNDSFQCFRPYEWKRTHLLHFSFARIILVPLFLLCALPRGAPILADECYPLVFSWLLGLTNGIVGSIPMIQAPSKVPEEHRELAGNIMTMSYITGLSIGSLVAYLMDACFGPSFQAKYVCPKPLKPSATPFANATLNILTNVVSSTLPTIEKTTTIPKLKTATTTILSTILTSTVLANNTMYTDLPTTIASKTFANVTASVSNAILQH